MAPIDPTRPEPPRTPVDPTGRPRPVLTEAELNDPRARLDAALEAAAVATFQWDLLGDRLFADRNMARLFGVPPEVAGGGPVAEYSRSIHPDDRDRVRATIFEAIESGAGYDVAYRLVRPDGTILQASTHGKIFRDAAGRAVQVAGVVADVTEKKAAEHQGRMLAAIVASSDDAIISKSLDGVITSWNRAAERIFGYGAAEIVGRHISTLMPPGYAEDLDKILGSIRRGERVEHYETKRRTRDGRIIDLSLTVSPIRDDDGTIIGASKVARDITERKRSEAARRAAEDELRRARDRTELALAATQFVGTWDWDILDDVVTADERFARLYGVDPGRAARGVPIAEFTRAIHPEDAERVGAAIDQVIRQGGEFQAEYRIIQADGSTRWVAARGWAQADAAGTVDRFPGVAVDITERKAVEELVRESEARFRQLADAMPQIVWTATPDGVVDYWNVRWYHFSGMPHGAAGDSSWTPVLHPDDLPRTLEVWGRSLASGEPYEVEYRLRRAADGVYRWHLGRALPVRDDSGALARWFGSCTDIDDRKQAAQERERLLAEAEAANRMKDEFLATLGHELRTPLNAIVGWAKILRGGADAEDLAEGLAAIERNSLVQSRLIEDLLDVSRIISGHLKLDVRLVHLPEVIDAALGAVAPAAQAKAIGVRTVVDPDAGPVVGDPARVQQMLWNLLANAVKFTPRGGQIRVILRRVESHVEVGVVDTGIGISPEFLPHVFDRFRQADSTTTRRHGGLGLGLSIVKQLAELHGGGVRVESRGEGEGSTFTISLPVLAVRPTSHPPEAALPEGTAPRPAALREGVLAGLKVLVVDDEPDARAVIRRVLAGSGAVVAVASSVGEALDLLDRDRPDVIVSDIGMPDVDGYDLIRQIRATHSGRDLPAAALTAFARAEDRKKALLAGFQSHVTKPVDPAELTAVVASLSGRIG